MASTTSDRLQVYWYITLREVNLIIFLFATTQSVVYTISITRRGEIHSKSNPLRTISMIEELGINSLTY